MTADKPSKYKTPVIKKDQPDDNFKFQPLPQASGNYPYHLNINTVIPAIHTGKMVFHMIGDTGSVRDISFLKKVAAQMAEQIKKDKGTGNEPQFLYHLGDIVYNYGEAVEYYGQFFEPFSQYPAPIFAIAGNHDADVNPDSAVRYQSLDPFTAVFCDSPPSRVVFGKQAARQSMIQPNVFWTMDTPLATIIGLFSNVPKFGVITAEQRDWFISELIDADTQRPDKAIIVCLHHAPFSADINHGSSLPMIEFLNAAFEEALVLPDLVVSGHVHNYQRFQKKYEDGRALTFLVAGAGGYDELHAIAAVADTQFTGDSSLFEGVTLQNYCDNEHGFLKIELAKTNKGVQISGTFYALTAANNGGDLIGAIAADSFTLQVK